MYKISKKIIIVALLVFLSSCSNTEDDSHEKELDSLRMENEMLKNEMVHIKKENRELVGNDVQISILSNELEKLNRELDNSREMEVTDSSLYRLRSDYFHGLFISETIRETNKGGFFLEKENIYDFKVSNDNELIAVLFFDKKSTNGQYLVLYDHEGNELCKYEIDDFWRRIDSSQYNGTEVIIFNGFSSGNEYLYGGLSHVLDIGVYFSIKIETGELIVYGSNNNDKYKELLEEFPYNR